MKTIILSLVILTNLLFAKSKHYTIKDVIYDSHLVKKYYKEINGFNREQWNVAISLYNACYKYDLGYTCVAIGWRESKLGIYDINEKTQDYGITGINIHYYFKDHNLKQTYWLKERIKTRLVRNDSFAIAECIWKLNNWRKVFGNNYKKIWGAYNGGSPNINYRYSKEILNFIIAFKRYNRRHNINLLFGKD